jgi:serine/threonine-protein kinase RsbW
VVQTSDTKVVSFSLPGGKSAAGLARRRVLSVRTDLPRTIRHRLALLLSEVVTNAVQHGGASPDHSLQVRLDATSERVRVEVLDPGSGDPQPHDRLTEGHGYGLLLLDHLADSWGRVEAEGGGSVAWFEIQLAGLAEA